MFTIIIVFLYWFQTDNIYPIYHPQRWLGYFAAGVLIFLSAEILISRRKKQEQIHKFSHSTDWLFPTLLLLTSVTGIGVHLFRYLGLPLATYYTYVIHLVICVPMLVIEVPFGKWSHLAYRPLAIYFHAVKKKASQQQMSREADLRLAPTIT
jgi:nitrate reductase gamma subunit